MLEAQLKATKQENNQQSEAILQTRQDILTNFSDLIETELQCSICNELYIQVLRIMYDSMKYEVIICITIIKTY